MGITKITAAAIISPQIITYSPFSEESPTVIVHFSGCVMNVRANKNSLHPNIPEYVAVAAIPGALKELMTEYIITIIDSINELRENKSNILIQKTKEYILANYNHDISLESIAHEIGLSTCYLSTLFKSIEDTSVKEYIIDVRINAAKELLKKEYLKIYEISADVGYTDSRYFSQLFRKKTGYTPGQYREFVHKT